MSEINPSHSTPQVQLFASPLPQLNTPSGLPEAILVAQLWRSTGLLEQFQDTVQVPRGRAGTYGVCDFTLLLLAYAVSQQHSFRDFRQQLAPYVGPLASLWQRAGLPSAAALSRFLADVDHTALQALGQLLFQDLLAHGIQGEGMGGLVDRLGQRQLLFDVDPTVEAVRQRALVASKDRPPPRRRRARACAPGYRGSKRGELVHSRVVVQQAHTREWLGSFGAPGNAHLWESLRTAASHIRQYLQHRGLTPSASLVRLDGAYGYARGAFILNRELGLGYLMRCADYRLLEHPQVAAALLHGEPASFAQLDTGTQRVVYDVGTLQWRAGEDATICVPARLVVTASPAPIHGTPRVGKLVGGKVYELFVTDRAPEGLTATDLLSLYFGRGGFEGALAEEAGEVDPDHWLSNHRHGQEFWQLLAQQVWNQRLRLGFCQEPEALRRTLWAEALHPGESEEEQGATRPESLEAAAPAAAHPPGGGSEESAGIAGRTPALSAPPSRDRPGNGTPTPGELPELALRPAVACGSPGKFSGKDFSWQEDGKLSCPEGKGLDLVERRREGESYRRIYEAKAEDCRVCALAGDCLRTGAQSKHGRRVSFLEAVEAAFGQKAGSNRDSPLPSSGPTIVGVAPVLWEDLPARALRRGVWKPLSQQRVEVESLPSVEEGAGAQRLVLTRDQRAHRRLTWRERLARNALSSHGPPWRIRLYGVARTIAEKLGITWPAQVAV